MSAAQAMVTAIVMIIKKLLVTIRTFLRQAERQLYEVYHPWMENSRRFRGAEDSLDDAWAIWESILDSAYSLIGSKSVEAAIELSMKTDEFAYKVIEFIGAVRDMKEALFTESKIMSWDRTPDQSTYQVIDFFSGHDGDIKEDGGK